MIVGFHFFKEGTNKVKSGGFSSAGFLAGARGPLAPLFRGMVDDHDGSQTLCVVRQKEGDRETVKIDPEQTLAIWDDFGDAARSHYGFGSPQLIKELQDERERLAQAIQKARQEKDVGVDTQALEQQREALAVKVRRIANQPMDVDRIFKSHQESLIEWIKVNRVDVLAHFQSDDRLQGFQRDGNQRDRIAVEVDAVRGQVDRIKSDRYKKLKSWIYEVSAMWDSIELQVNELAVEDQRFGKSDRPLASLAVQRPFDQPTSRMNVVDAVIPWFDTVVGVCLILGLFTRLASFAAGTFLLSVAMTQPFWVPGTDPTYYIWIEVGACFVIFASLAGRIGGLDYLIHDFFRRRPDPDSAG